MTVKVNGKRYWLKVKVVKTLPKPSTPSTPSKPVSPSNPSTPSTPSNPSTPGTTGKTYMVRFNKQVGNDKRTYTEGTVLNLTGGAFADTTHSDPSYKFMGWSLSPNGSVVSSVKVTGNIELYSVWVAKDPMKDWNPTFVQGTATNLASDTVFENDGLESYTDMKAKAYGFKEAWVKCDCGKTFQFKVKDHRGNVIVVDHFLYDWVNGTAYVLAQDVQSNHDVSSDWMFINITSAAWSVTTIKDHDCSALYKNAGTHEYNCSTSATYKK